MTASNIIPFPKPKPVVTMLPGPDTESRIYMLSKLSHTARDTMDAVNDIADASRALWRGKGLRDTDAVLSGETIGSFVSSTIRMIDLRGSHADLDLRRALTRWLDDNGGADV